MNVSVAVGALRAHIFEHHARMALRATHVLVHSAEGITSLIVIEIGMGANRLPTCIGVAVRARNG